MKKVFFTHLGYLCASVIFIILGLFLIVILLISLANDFNDQTEVKIIALIITFLFTLFFVITFGLSFIQWVEIDEGRIVAKSLFNTILDVKWEDVKKVYIDSFPFSHKDVFLSKWIVFDDGRNNTFKGNGINTKGNFIKIRWSEKNILIIKTFWHKEILRE